MPSRILAFVTALLLLAAFAAPTPAQAAAAPVPREVIIKDISKAGAVIDLMDGSQWRINDIDEQKTVYESWLPAQTVIVEPGNRLRNIYTGEEVQAVRLKKATKLPSPDKTAAAPARPGGQAAAPAAPPAVAAPLSPQLEAKIDKLISLVQELDLKVRLLDARVTNLERGLGVMR